MVEPPLFGITHRIGHVTPTSIAHNTTPKTRVLMTIAKLIGSVLLRCLELAEHICVSVSVESGLSKARLSSTVDEH
jgi:hypothetical protein